MKFLTTLIGIVVLVGAAAFGPPPQQQQQQCTAHDFEFIEFYGEVDIDQDFIYFLPYNREAFAYPVSWGRTIQRQEAEGWFSITIEQDDVYVEVYGDEMEFAEWFGTAPYVVNPQKDDETSCRCHYSNICSAEITCPKGHKPYCSCKKSGNSAICRSMCVAIKPNKLTAVMEELEAADDPVMPKAEPPIVQ